MDFQLLVKVAWSLWNISLLSFLWHSTVLDTIDDKFLTSLCITNSYLIRSNRSTSQYRRIFNSTILTKDSLYQLYLKPVKDRPRSFIFGHNNLKNPPSLQSVLNFDLTFSLGKSSHCETQIKNFLSLHVGSWPQQLASNNGTFCPLYCSHWYFLSTLLLPLFQDMIR